jgi:ABC-2 type transport system permease protein
MILKNLFSNLTKQNMKRRLWSLSISILVFFFALPIFSFMAIGNWMNRLERGMTTFPEILEQFQLSILGSKNYFLTAITVFIAVTFAISGFNFLFSKAKVDLYHSSPIKRETQFLTCFINGILFYIIPYAISLVITLFIGQSYHLLNSQSLAFAFSTLLINFLGFLFIYSVTIFAVLLTGNICVSLLSTGVYLGYGPTIISLYYYCCGEFFKTYYSPSTPYNLFSPITVLLGTLASYTEEHPSYDWVSILKMLIGTAVFILAGIITYKKRPSESANQSVAFPRIKPIIKIGLIVPLSLISGLFFKSVAYSNSVFWFIFGIIIALLLSHAIIEIIFQFDFKAAIKNLHHLVIGGTIVTIIACTFYFDLFKYDSYLPLESSIDNIAIASYDLSGNINYYNFDSSKTINPSDMYQNFYIDTIAYRLEHMKLVNNSEALKLARLGVSNALSNRNSNRNIDFEDNQNNGYSRIYYKYTLVNNKEVYRSYDINMKDAKDLYSKIYASKEYKEAVFPVLTAKDSDIKNVYFANPLDSKKLTNFTQEELIELIHTYQKELLAQHGNEIYDEIPLGNLFTRVFNETNPNNYWDLNECFIYPSFKKTIEILESHDVDLYSIYDPSNIKSITILDYSDEEKGDYSEKEYTSQNDIDKIMEYAVPYDAIYTNSGLIGPTKYDVNINYKNSNKFENSSGYFTFSGDNIPEFIK